MYVLEQMGLKRLSGRNLSLYYASISWKLGVLLSRCSAAGDYPQFKGLLALFPTPCLSMSLSTREPGVCPADHGGAHAACVVCLSPPSRVRLGALKKSSPWEFLPLVASCCSLLARIVSPILSSHQPPPLGRFHIG